ncbi:polysaccharide biosynthesis protein [Balneola sp. MJW-20]|uniref:polysaccharide biosynthesis protein n=1 Tax=Gracilimonas aurantiaca TaxID=3234185 RepID=UPI0034675194
MDKILLEHRNWIKVVADAAIWSLLTIPAFILRFEFNVGTWLDTMLITAAVLMPFKLFVIIRFGWRSRSWQYSSVTDLLNLFKWLGGFTLIYFMTSLAIRPAFVVPLSVPVIEGMMALIVLGGMRFMARLYFIEYIKPKKVNGEIKRVMIAGAGDAGSMMAREMMRHPESGYKPVVFIDDNPVKWDQKISGIPIAGRTSELCNIAKEYKCDELIIAMPAESGDVIRRVVENARKCKLSHKIIPGLHELISGKVDIKTLRNVDLEDLLRRKPVQLDQVRIEEYVNHRRVMVTGAGGSIGSEIVRQIAKFEPESIVLLGRGENSIHRITREMMQNHPEIKLHIKIADVRDVHTMERIFEEARPEVVFHAAAHKHVPLMEKNPDQAIFNNVGGTRNLVNLSLDYGVKHFVNISTDKAINPTSVMGASKRIAEYVVERGSLQADPDQTFVSVRFGNVLGSRGSVIPIFREQIRKGGPVTVTDPDMVRYFMTIPEASQLVLMAGALRENGAVFVLDMGEPVRILDMARDLIRLSGLEPDKDIRIEITGKRPGEKLYEELLTDEEGTTMSRYEKIMMANRKGLPEHFGQKLNDLFTIAESGDSYSIREMIHRIVPSYSGLPKAESD